MTTVVKEKEKEIIAIHEKEITVKAIRARFPKPESVRNGVKENWYCVGGALYMTVFGDNGNLSSGFPGKETIEYTLIKANPKLEKDVARKFAFDITLWNDEGEFEKAWNLLDKALNYGKKKE